jgi:adenylyl-sulfate kinase
VKVCVFWLGRSPLVLGDEYLLKLGTARVPFRVEQIHRVIDASALDPSDARTQVDRNEVAECTFELAKPLAFDTADHCSPTGRFVIVDNFEISGGGIVREALPERQAMLRRIHVDPAVVWFTGLSGAGKSTIAREVHDRLQTAGVKVEYLDGDTIRTVFPATGYTRPDRDEHVRRVGFLASRLEHHGVVVICALISPYLDSRAQIRRLCGRFVEIHVSTPLDECERRDVKGLYQRARRGEISNFTGLDDAYEPPVDPELRIDTTGISVEEAADIVMSALQYGHAFDDAGRTAS